MTNQEDLVRIDETWFRLRDWTQGQAASERLAAQMLDTEGFMHIDPSHPLGGKDGGRDGHCTRDDEPWVWAVYFPRGEQSYRTDIEKKFQADVVAARTHKPKGIAFVTNQEIRLGERAQLRSLANAHNMDLDLFHLERLASILDRPRMHPVREQYLKIAVGPPPMLIETEVVGVARAFADEGAVFNFLVDQRKNDIRKRSDQAWEKVRAEERKQARQRAAEAEKARMDALLADPYGRFTDAGLSMHPALMSNMADFVPKFEPTEYLSRLMAGTHGFPHGNGPESSKPLSDDEIAVDVERFRRTLEARWSRCREYLASHAWSGLQFRVQNMAKSFLTNVQVTLIFHSGKGIAFANPTLFHYRKFEDPDWRPAADQLTGRIAIPHLEVSPIAGAPVEWGHDDDGDLRVTITLPELRPYPEWRSGDHDVVLYTPDSALEQVTVTYKATAHGYGDVFEGTPITIPVQKVDMFKTYRDAFDVQYAESKRND